MDKLKTFLRNLKSVHHRIMMRYLRKRNWVVFYLEPENRKCNVIAIVAGLNFMNLNKKVHNDRFRISING